MGCYISSEHYMIIMLISMNKKLPKLPGTMRLSFEHRKPEKGQREVTKTNKS